MSITPNNPNVGGGGGASVNPSVFGHIGSLPNVKPVPCRGSNLIIGTTDLYSCPTGKRAFVSFGKASNASGGSVSVFLSIKVGSTYTQISTTVAALANATSTDMSVGVGYGIVLEAGEKLAITCSTTAGLNVDMTVYEFDDTANFKTVKNLALTNGANTLYTCPTGKNASFGFTHLNDAVGVAAASAIWPGMAICNASGGSLNYTINNVPSGGAVGSGNQILPTTALATATASGYGTGSNLGSEDFISVTTSAGTAGQAAWVNVWEM